MVIANDHYQAIGIVCLSVIGGVQRVACKRSISFNFICSDLLHIESNCRTPEKMALALLDYLFDRDTQACSNLSGLGRHGKKKLDPLFVYGLRCQFYRYCGIFCCSLFKPSVFVEKVLKTFYLMAEAV